MTLRRDGVKFKVPNAVNINNASRSSKNINKSTASECVGDAFGIWIMLRKS